MDLDSGQVEAVVDLMAPPEERSVLRSFVFPRQVGDAEPLVLPLGVARGDVVSVERVNPGSVEVVAWVLEYV